MVKLSLVHYVTKWLVDIMFYGGIVVCALLPFFMPLFSFTFGYISSGFGVNALTLTLVSSGLCAVYILHQLRILLRSVIGGDPFVQANISCFRKCGVASFLIALVYAIRFAQIFTAASAIIFVTFAMLGLFSLTLKDVFKQAVFYKEENDWTV